MNVEEAAARCKHRLGLGWKFGVCKVNFHFVFDLKPKLLEFHTFCLTPTPVMLKKLCVCCCNWIDLQYKKCSDYQVHLIQFPETLGKCKPSMQVFKGIHFKLHSYIQVIHSSLVLPVWIRIMIARVPGRRWTHMLYVLSVFKKSWSSITELLNQILFTGNTSQ